MLILFFGSKGVVHKEFVPEDQTVTKELYKVLDKTKNDSQKRFYGALVPQVSKNPGLASSEGPVLLPAPSYEKYNSAPACDLRLCCMQQGLLGFLFLYATGDVAS